MSRVRVAIRDSARLLEELESKTLTINDLERVIGELEFIQDLLLQDLESHGIQPSMEMRKQPLILDCLKKELLRRKNKII